MCLPPLYVGIFTISSLLLSRQLQVEHMRKANGEGAWVQRVWLISGRRTQKPFWVGSSDPCLLSGGMAELCASPTRGWQSLTLGHQRCRAPLSTRLGALGLLLAPVRVRLNGCGSVGVDHPYSFRLTPQVSSAASCAWGLWRAPCRHSLNIETVSRSSAEVPMVTLDSFTVAKGLADWDEKEKKSQRNTVYSSDGASHCTWGKNRERQKDVSGIVRIKCSDKLMVK